MKKALATGLLLAAFSCNLPLALAQPKDRVVPGKHLPTPVANFYSASSFLGITLADATAMAAFLSRQFPAAQYGVLRQESVVSSPLGTHYIFRQYYRNRPVYKSDLKISLSPEGQILSLTSGLHKLPEKRSTQAVKASETIASQHLLHLLGKDLAKADYTVEQTLFLAENSLNSGLVITYGSRITSIGSKEILLDSKGQVRDEYDLITNYKHGHNHDHDHAHQAAVPAKVTPILRDTAVSVVVYPVLPKAHGSVKHRAPLFAQSEQVKQQLNASRQWADLQAVIRNDTFLLRSPYCIVKEFDPPTRPEAYSLTPSFNYQLGDEGFDQVNVLYHITAWQNHLQKLGFTNLASRPIEVDANGWNGQDQSSYTSFTNTLSFGVGGVADAQDPQVIIHEYSHAMSRSAGAGAAVAYERKVLEEANADYFAVSYKKATDPTDWERIFTWDGHNEFWPGRLAVSNKSYPADLTGDIYDDAALWTATLMQVQEQIGREATDRLVMQSIYSYSSYLDIPGAAKLLLQADSLLYNSRHSARITALFSQRGILPKAYSAKQNLLAPAGPRTPEAATFINIFTTSPTPTFSTSQHKAAGRFSRLVYHSACPTKQHMLSLTARLLQWPADASCFDQPVVPETLDSRSLLLTYTPLH